MKKFLQKEIVFIAILIISVFVIYGKSINFELIEWDDNAIITNGKFYISDFNNFSQLFLKDCYYTHNSTYYRPVLPLSFMVESVLFGFNPSVYHVTNIILYILAIYLMYVFCLKLKINKNILKFVCLLTAVHPVFNSSVLWISARNDTLLAVFVSLSFINFINYIEFGKIKYLLLQSLFFALALFTKETAAITLFMYVMFLYCFEYKITKKQLIKSTVIFILISLLYFTLRKMSVPDISIENYLIGIRQYFSNMVTAIMTYIDKMVTPDYIPVMLYNVKLSLKAIILNSLSAGILIFLYVKNIIKRKIMIFALVWFFLYLLPTFLVPDYILLFHRLVLPWTAAVLIIAEMLKQIIVNYPVSKKYLTALFVVLFISYSYASYKQQDKYKDSISFWTNAYIDASNYHQASSAISKCYMDKGDYVKAKEFIKKAIDLYPREDYLVVSSTLSLLIDNDLDKAQREYLKILEKNSKNALCYAQLSLVCYRKNDLNKALEYAKNAVAIEQNPEYLQHLGEMYIKNNEYDNAIKIYLKLIKFNEMPQFYYILEYLHKKTGDFEKAKYYKEKALGKIKH